MNLNPNIQIVHNLFEFESVVDVDLSIIMYIIKNMNDNNKFINEDFIRFTPSLNGIQNRLLFRTTNNPLSIIIKKEYHDSINDIYNELMANHKQEIINNAIPTSIMNFYITGTNISGVVNNYINCKDEIEKQYIHKYTHTAQIKNNENDMKKYNTIYVKSVNSLFNYKNLVHKKIFIFNARFNMMNDYLIYKPEAMAISTVNTICTIDPYNNLTIPSIGGFLT